MAKYIQLSDDSDLNPTPYSRVAGCIISVSLRNPKIVHLLTYLLTYTVGSGGLTENTGHENDGPSKLQDMKSQDKISTILSTQEAQAQVRRRLVARADTPRSSCLQLLPVSPLTWKSSQSLQQVMPWMVAGRLRHLRHSLLWCHTD